MDIQYEHIKFIIGRFDHYFDSINNKSAFYIAINTFILGGVCVGYVSLYEKLKIHLITFPLFLLIFLLISCIVSTILTIMAMCPFSKDNFANDDSCSLMYFGGIAKHQLSFFKDKFNELDDDSIQNDALQQAHCLAKGLKRKFGLLKVANYFLILQYCTLLPLIYFIFKNLA